MNPIILYDISTSVQGKALSYNAWKIRICLNIKGLAHKTEWVECPDIEPLFKKLNINPTGKKPWDGSDRYTVPAIYDPSTGTYLADSFLIAQYLDRAYQSTPRIFPLETSGLQLAFEEALTSNISSLWAFTTLPSWEKLNPVSQQYVRKVKERISGMILEEEVPQAERAVEEWKKFEVGLGNVDAWYSMVSRDANDSFIMGEVSWADIVITSYMFWLQGLFGEESQKWKDISTWQGGRWGALFRKFKKYSAVF